MWYLTAFLIWPVNSPALVKDTPALTLAVMAAVVHIKLLRLIVSFTWFSRILSHDIVPGPKHKPSAPLVHQPHGGLPNRPTISPTGDGTFSRQLPKFSETSEV
jgi:hypothetical protein